MIKPRHVKRIPRHGTATYVRSDRNPNPNVVATSFKHKGNNLTLKVRARRADNKYQIEIPAILCDSKSRKSITFGTKFPFGLNPRFLQFLMSQLQILVSSWKTFKAAKDWVGGNVREKNGRKLVSKRMKWRNKQVRMWGKYKRRPTRNCTRGTRKRPRVECVEHIVMVVSPHKKVDDIVIEMPGISNFDNMGRGCRLKVTTVVPKRGSKNNPRVTVWVPKVLCGPAVKQGYRVSMGTNYGASEEWQKFVAEYLQVNAREWKTISQGKTWVSKRMAMFKRLLNLGYEHHLRQNKGEKRVWFVAPSELPRCQTYMDTGRFESDCEVGNGLWTKESGKIDIYFGEETEWTRKVDRSKTKLTRQEEKYMVRADPGNENIVLIPTKEAFACKTIADGFMVNHV